MKQPTQPLTGALLTGLLLSGFATLCPAQSFLIDFESGYTAGANLYNQGATAAKWNSNTPAVPIITVIANGGVGGSAGIVSNAVIGTQYINNNFRLSNTDAGRNFPADGLMSFSFDMQMLSIPGGAAYSWGINTLRDTFSPDAAKPFEFNLGDQGQIWINNAPFGGSGQAGLVSNVFTNTTGWANFSGVVDYTNRKTTVTVTATNGTQTTKEIGFTSVTGLGQSEWGSMVLANTTLNPPQVAFDNFRFSAVPEPSTWAGLVGLGALLVSCWRRRG